MAFPINKVLSLPHQAISGGTPERVQAEVEKLLGRRVLWVDYKKLPSKNGMDRFQVISANTERDK